MIALADEQALYLLQFADKKNLATEINNLGSQLGKSISFSATKPSLSIQHELAEYFAGNLYEFKTPFILSGTSFQKKVWDVLCTITSGQTISYKTQAQKLNKPHAFRAVANANAANHLAILVPCHRVVTHDGLLGGYAGGVKRKAWLLDHEKAYYGKSHIATKRAQ